VATPVPFGSKDKPYQVVILPPAGSDTSPKALNDFLNERTGQTFKVTIATSEAELLDSVCTSVPTFAWVDGWALLAAQAKNCGNVALRIKQGDATGIKSDIVISPAAAIDSVAALRNRAKTRDFCRLDSQDVTGWILPVAVLRGPGFDPFVGFKSVKDYGDPNAIIQDVSDNKCVAAIPSGTLTNFKAANVADITKTVKVLATSPELPYGGLMVSPTVPRKIADVVTNIFSDPNALDQLKGLVTADSLVPATNDDYADTMKAFQAGGFNFAALGR
jgi:ABC-type phosphate/phosphonate transport system substrate-binding protein